MGKINFWSVNKNVSIDPNECFFTLGKEDHVLVQHKMSVMFDEFSGSVDDLEGNFEGQVVGTKLPESRDFMAFVFFCPDLLSVIEEFPKKN